jgi:hypothetical protein
VNKIPDTLKNLGEYRRSLQDFSGLHVDSLRRFHLHLSFKVHAHEPNNTIPEDGVRHLTSTATCYSSMLEDCPNKFWPDNTREHLFAQARKFADAALIRGKWQSDGSADIYCRCRALPFVVTHLTNWRTEIEGHLSTIFEQWNDETRPAIGEVAPGEKDKKKWYPPNAYHTFWTLDVIDAIRSQKRFTEQYATLNKSFSLDTRQQKMEYWAYQKLLYQIALHSAKSSRLDSDELAWSLAIFLRNPERYRYKIAEQDLVAQAFKCLFSTQEDNGSWRHYNPLFHYQDSGNAYCYVFETFTWLLKQVLRPDAEFARELLRKHLTELVKLWNFAERIETVIEEGKILAWSSGHRLILFPESWATASVFAYAQALRRLLGIWSREEALKSLPRRKADGSMSKAQSDLNSLSKSWSRTKSDMATLLWSMFINPVAPVSLEEELEPDSQPIQKDAPRAAILFGPPGTGKTSLVRAIAASIGWNYIELHPSHFVAEGLPKVQYTADVIFRTLMELDHAVVLFDEVDELVRERDIEPDQFGRFLTTSMLPRLAELWKARKIMYFVATNHIEYFDRAVTRSERFDAILYIRPPSFEAKCKRLREILSTRFKLQVQFAPQFTKETVEAAIPRKVCEAIDRGATKEKQEVLKSTSLDKKYLLSKFALLRWDELDELAEALIGALGTSTMITGQVLKKALSKIRDEKARTMAEYYRFTSDYKYERYDVSKLATWIVEFVGGPATHARIKDRGDHQILQANVGAVPSVQVPGYLFEQATEARIRYIKDPPPIQKPTIKSKKTPATK